MSDNKRKGLIEKLTRKLGLPQEKTDVDFRPPRGPGRDVIAGWEERPRVPGSTEDQVR